jgi:hypothetical protein
MINKEILHEIAQDIVSIQGQQNFKKYKEIECKCTILVYYATNDLLNTRT